MDNRYASRATTHHVYNYTDLLSGSVTSASDGKLLSKELKRFSNIARYVWSSWSASTSRIPEVEELQADDEHLTRLTLTVLVRRSSTRSAWNSAACAARRHRVVHTKLTNQRSRHPQPDGCPDDSVMPNTVKRFS